MYNDRYIVFSKTNIHLDTIASLSCGTKCGQGVFGHKICPIADIVFPQRWSYHGIGTLGDYLVGELHNLIGELHDAVTFADTLKGVSCHTFGVSLR